MTTRHCPTCKKEWHDVPDHVLELFHYCQGRRTPTEKIIVGTPTIEEKRTAMFHAIATGLGSDALLRPLDDDEAAS